MVLVDHICSLGGRKAGGDVPFCYGIRTWVTSQALARSHVAMFPHVIVLLMLGIASAEGGPAGPPYSAELFVRGSFNVWHTSHPMSYDAEANRTAPPDRAYPEPCGEIMA